MANAFRSYLLVQRLENISSKYVRFAWGPQELEHFDRIKTALQLPRTNKPFAGGSSFCVGAILVEDHQDGRHPVEYFTKRLVGLQLKYTTEEKTWQW
jgi:hypothetical protein